jgi:acyl carrier protein
VIESVIYGAIIEESSLTLTTGSISNQLSFSELGVDSLAIVSVIILIEDYFKIVITGKEISSMLFVSDLIDTVKRKQSG